MCGLLIRLRLMKGYTDGLLLVCFFICVLSAAAQTVINLPLQAKKFAYAQEVEQEAIRKKDLLMMAEAYYLYGKVYVAAHDYLTAKDYYMKSMAIVERRHEYSKMARLYLRLSEFEQSQANMRKALEYAHLALSIWKQVGIEKNIAAAYQQIGAVYVTICSDSLSKNRSHPLLDSLLYYCKAGERMAYKLKDTLAIASLSTTLGNFYRLQRNPKAFQYYRTSLNLYKAIGHKLQQTFLIQELALTHLRFNQPTEAYPLLQEAEERYNALHMREFYNEQAFADAYMQYFQQKKRWESAFIQSQLVRSYEYNQLIADREGAVSRLSVEYDTKKKEAQLKSQQRELTLSNKNQQIQRLFLGVLSAMLIGMIVASGLFYRLSRKNQRLSLHNAALVQEQNHRVKNNLQLVSSLLSLQSNRLSDESAKNAVADSQRRIEVMSLLHRKLYDADNLIHVNVADFIRELTDMVLETFDLQQVKTSYQLPATITLSADYVMRIGLIVNELVTNSCKYAFCGHPDPTLYLEVTLDKNRFWLRVADNGKGVDVTKLPLNTFGLRLIQIQVEQLYGTYKFENKDGMSCDISFNLIPSSAA
jgi:two-component sensor histidine kinase